MGVLKKKKIEKKSFTALFEILQLVFETFSRLKKTNKKKNLLSDQRKSLCA